MWQEDIASFIINILAVIGFIALCVTGHVMIYGL
jgi:hypothetical protein